MTNIFQNFLNIFLSNIKKRLLKFNAPDKFCFYSNYAFKKQEKCLSLKIPSEL